MWNRAYLKENAKMAIQRGYWTSFLVCLLCTVLRAGSGGEVFNLNVSLPLGIFQSGEYYYYSNSAFANFLFTLLTSGIALVAVLAVAAYVIFVANPLEVGRSRYFITSRNSHSEFTLLFYSFQPGQYMNIVKAMGLRSVYIFLWSLLFVFPGIIKSYAYRMVPYIMAENPTMDPRRAIQLSEQMTQGEKLQMFILDLSFVGWFFLGTLLCGVGTMFVQPYFEATYTELYGSLRYKAIQMGFCHPSELGESPSYY